MLERRIVKTGETDNKSAEKEEGSGGKKITDVY
jgi:hypothetical protein